MDLWAARIVWILSVAAVTLGQGSDPTVDLFCPDGMTAK